jgi:hypothetical protein
MTGDWIKLHRKSLESLVNSDAGLMHLWVNLLLRANWKPSWFLKKKIDIGQVAFSVGNFADVLKVSASTLRRRLAELQGSEAITVDATNRFTIVTICNWSTYQEDAKTSRRADEQTDDAASGEQAASSRRTDDTHPKKLRRVRKKEGKNLSADAAKFLEIWNRAKGASGIRELSDKRLASLEARLKETIGDVPWLEVLEKAVAENFPLKCFGDDGWKPDGDWILKPDSLLKVIEGKYDWVKNGSANNGDPRGNLALRDELKRELFT